mmetsp:Transcript_4399/g.10357  ORF Transcript_4399/g.10357 Transcript_4399/m.10357 type:complete len:373 (-) Transcript_4399:14-1132(-)
MKAGRHAAVVLFSLNVHGRIPDVNAPVSAPTRLTSYNIDAAGAVHCPGKALRTFHKPSPGCDLNVGMDSFVEKKTGDGTSIQPILSALHTANHKLDSNIHFVTFRNNLNKIMETPYNDKNEWRIGLEREAGTIYMHVVQLEDSFSSSADQKKFQYWGYKFEELCCKPPDNSDDAAKASGEDGAVNANVEFCSVFRMSFGHSRLIVAAEMDCAEPAPHQERAAGEDEEGLGKRKRREAEEAADRFVEIKTSREMTAPHHRRTFERFKLLKFWIQSFVGGVRSICCGFRDDTGIVTHVEVFQTLEIPRLVRGKANMWDARRCIDFTAWVLGEVRRATVDGARYELRYQHPFTHVTLVRLDPPHDPSPPPAKAAP